MHLKKSLYTTYIKLTAFKLFIEFGQDDLRMAVKQSFD